MGVVRDVYEQHESDSPSSKYRNRFPYQTWVGTHGPCLFVRDMKLAEIVWRNCCLNIIAHRHKRILHIPTEQILNLKK